MSDFCSLSWRCGRPPPDEVSLTWSDFPLPPAADYRDTAAKFQKEWRVAEPHRHFTFAPHVRDQALVQALNRGLQYYSLEREFAKSLVRDSLTLSLFFFFFLTWSAALFLVFLRIVSL